MFRPNKLISLKFRFDAVIFDAVIFPVNVWVSSDELPNIVEPEDVFTILSDTT